ncbi:MAG: thiamine-monophosphate kinase [Kiritimatiellia bacterium]|jgi:thiamine-monophosphate kinase
MPLNEFDIIKKYFTRPSTKKSVNKSVGDDCAIVSLAKNKQLVMSMDTLVSARHFPVTATPYQIATRALCTSLSDLAAMGANPLWFTLGLTLPNVDEMWLKSFSEGLFSIANAFDIDLIGGDTTRGPLTVTVQVHGEVDQGKALLRSCAQIGDAIFVTGCLGDGAAGLAMLQNQLPVNKTTRNYLLSRFYAPTPHILAGKSIASFANSAIDISDGLLADAGHIAVASGVGMEINIECLPIAKLVKQVAADSCIEWALTGGDDYQLLFTVSPQQLPNVQSLLDQGMIKASHIGEVVDGDGQASNGRVSCFLQGAPYDISDLNTGYQHFVT